MSPKFEDFMLLKDVESTMSGDVLEQEGLGIEETKTSEENSVTSKEELIKLSREAGDLWAYMLYYRHAEDYSKVAESRSEIMKTLCKAADRKAAEKIAGKMSDQADEKARVF